MSFVLTARAMQADVESSVGKFVLVCLADAARDGGVCWPCYETIAQTCCISRRTAIKHVNELERLGWIKKETRKHENGKNQSNRFRLNLSKLPPLKNRKEDGQGASKNKFRGAAGSPRRVQQDHPEPISKEPITRDIDLLSANSKSERRKKPEAFKEFYKKYPALRKGGTDATVWDKWKKLKLSDECAEQALSWLEAAARVEPRWRCDSDGKFIPGIVRFISEQRWLQPLPKQAAMGINQQAHTQYPAGQDFESGFDTEF